MERAWLVWEDASRAVAAHRATTEHALRLRDSAGGSAAGRPAELMAAANERLAADAAQLAAELGDAGGHVPPELAPFDAPSWLTWQPRADVADGILLGHLGTPEMPGLRMPLVMRMPWRSGVWITGGPVPGAATAFTWSLVTRFLAALPPGLAGIEVVDASGLSGAQWVNGLDPRVRDTLAGGGAVAGPQASERLRALLDLVDLRGVGGEADELPPGLRPGPPVRLLVVLDVGAALDGDDAHHLVRLAEDGPAAGVPVLLAETGAPAGESVRAMRVRQACGASLPGGEDTIRDGWTGHDWTLTPDTLADAREGAAPALLAHVLGAHARAVTGG